MKTEAPTPKKKNPGADQSPEVKQGGAYEVLARPSGTLIIPNIPAERKKVCDHFLRLVRTQQLQPWETAARSNLERKTLTLTTRSRC